jgi:hypothetical protein
MDSVSAPVPGVGDHCLKHWGDLCVFHPFHPLSQISVLNLQISVFNFKGSECYHKCSFSGLAK